MPKHCVSLSMHPVKIRSSLKSHVTHYRSLIKYLTKLILCCLINDQRLRITS